MKLTINILIAIWMFFMSAFYASMPLKFIANLTGIEILRSSQLRGLAILISIGFLVAFVKQTKTGKTALMVMLGITLYFVSRMLIGIIFTHESPLTGQPYPLKSYISLSLLLLINTALLVWQIKINRANQVI